MKSLLIALLIAAAVVGPVAAQPPAPKPVIDGSSLGWLAGSRMHKNPDGSPLYESFIGPINGVMTGTALNGAGTGAYTEFHRFASNAEGQFGLSVQNSRTNAWNFTPLKSIEVGKVVFQSTNGATTITYWDKGRGRVGATVDRVADGKTTRSEWSFEPVRR